eukprot:gene14707-biopygen12190
MARRLRDGEQDGNEGSAGPASGQSDAPDDAKIQDELEVLDSSDSDFIVRPRRHRARREDRRRQDDGGPQRKETADKLYPHLPRARGDAADGGVLLGRKLLSLHTALQSCGHSAANQEAVKELDGWTQPHLLPKGLRKGCAVEKVKDEFRCSEYSALCLAAVKASDRPVYFNPCWVKSPDWGSAGAESGVRVDRNLLIHPPAVVDDPRKWYVDRFPAEGGI